jgi:2-(1,2-epoxy-1,2-dihydrophenyl)acetyl-CoA isomerase
MNDLLLLVERDGAVATITFNRPEVLNALNVAMAEAFAAACQELADDASVRVVVLRGNGKAFMAGGDLQALRAHPADTVNALIPPVHEAVRLLASMPKPVLASVQGAAAGAGMSVVLAADLAIAAAGTRFNFAYSDIGTSCDGGMSWSLPRLVGLRKAMEIAMLSDALDADKAMRLGLVNEVVAADNLSTATMALAQRLASREAASMAHLKQLLRASWGQNLADQLDAEHAAFLDCAQRPGFTAAIDNFFNKRIARR